MLGDIDGLLHDHINRRRLWATGTKFLGNNTGPFGNIFHFQTVLHTKGKLH
ncbi:Uncharacterised protein [Vibrio cholerae]|nr:Uncharacterised protein [Vibrio cholerae]CSI93822.1 Uncharacterised protein [Vibrio cholerae]